MPKMENYPSAQDAIAQEEAGKPPMPPEGAQGAGIGKDNPVIGALQTVAKWVGSMQEKGDPKAAQVVEAFKALLQALGAGEAMGEMEAPPEAAPPAVPMPAKGGDVMAGGRGMPMGMAGNNKNAKVM